jgi:hypothetical protein
MSIEGTSTPSLQDIVSKHSAPAQDAPATEVVEEVAVEASEEVVEAPVTEEVRQPEPPKRDPAAARFGALAKKERELRNQMSSFETKMKEFEARENAIKEREMRFQAARRPTEKLKELGFTYADITQDLLGNYKEPELDPMDEKLKPFKENWDKFEGVSEKLAKEVEQLKNQIALKEQKEVYGQVIGEIKSVLADNDKYELTNTMGQEGLDLIQEVVLEYYNENEILLDYSAACDIVEKYYEDQIMSKVAGTKKMKSRFAAPQEPVKPSKPSPATKEPSVPKTLTQAHSTGSKATPNVDEMTKEQALAYLSKKIIFKQD